MSEAYQIFTINGKAVLGAKIAQFRISGAGISIPAILVGEEGRGRELGILPISTIAPCGPDRGESQDLLVAATIGKTAAGRPKLFEAEKHTTDSHVIVVLLSGIGYRGGNSHTGDRHNVPCSERNKFIRSYRVKCPICGVDKPSDAIAGQEWLHPDSGTTIKFDSFPGEILVQGRIAQGDAGRMGSGTQMVALIPKNGVFRVAYHGRQVGATYYKWDGKLLLAATWQERQVSDIF